MFSLSSLKNTCNCYCFIIDILFGVFVSFHVVVFSRSIYVHVVWYVLCDISDNDCVKRMVLFIFSLNLFIMYYELVTFWYLWIVIMVWYTAHPPTTTFVIKYVLSTFQKWFRLQCVMKFRWVIIMLFLCINYLFVIIIEILWIFTNPPLI